jgi:hypothetical protein
MTIVANTALTFSMIGNREDVANIIYNIAPTDCPFTASIGKTKADATNHEWQIDSLAAAATNAQLEGDDIASYDAVTRRPARATAARSSARPSSLPAPRTPSRSTAARRSSPTSSPRRARSTSATSSSP